MRFGNRDGRLVLLSAESSLDVERASGGRFGPDPMSAYDDWMAFRTWAEAHPLPVDAESQATGGLLSPVPRPPQIVAVARSYRDVQPGGGQEELGVPEGLPPTFAKFPSSVTGPDSVIELAGEFIDWEVELVVVIGTPMYRVPEAEVWSHVAGLTVGQDLTDRGLQRSGAVPQFALAKSSPGFTPIGPAVVTLDEFDDLDALELSCHLNGELVQQATLRQLAYPLPTLLARLSRVVALLPGDLVFTGTPGGSGMTHTPPRYLRPGDVLESTATGIGSLRQAFR